MATKKTTRKTSPKKAPAKTKRTAPAQAQKKVSQMQAAAIVLTQSQTPMTCGEMVTAMADQKLWSSPNGQTPAATLYAALLRHIRKHGKAGQFKKVGPGQFALTGK
ncbi:MAG: winged helix-turn-helix domain-containing protein [Planctomycetaceae bacterium]